MRQLTILSFAALFALSACGDDDPVSFSGPVTLSLKAKSDDVKSGVITEEKDVTTESGNPFGAFIRDAQGKLGKSPTDIRLSKITLLLGGDSKGVTGLEQVFTDKVDVLFEMNDTKNSFAAGSFAKVSGGTPVNGTASFDYSALGAADSAKFLSGSFKAVVRGDAAAGFGAAGKAEGELELTLFFEAFAD